MKFFNGYFLLSSSESTETEFMQDRLRRGGGPSLVLHNGLVAGNGATIDADHQRICITVLAYASRNAHA